MKRVLTFAAAALIIVAAPAASAIRHNRITMSAMGPLRLGMDQTTAKTALRHIRPGTLRSAQKTNLKGGLVYLEYSYYRGLGEDSYLVGYLGTRGKPRTLRVARIVTFVRADRTARGAHVGATIGALDRMYGSAMHCGPPFGSGRAVAYMLCRVGAASKRHIVLVLTKNDQSGWTVGRIVVEEPGLKIPIVQ